MNATPTSGAYRRESPRSGPLVWSMDGPHWPHHDASRFVHAAGLRWHVQCFGLGRHERTIVLLHGTGASTHSWRALISLLTDRYCVVVPDLPGHGFTTGARTHHLSMSGMGESLAALLQELDVAPAVAVGHSAGAALAAWMSLHGVLAPELLVAVNAALLPLRGIEGQIFSPLAKLLSSTSIAPNLFSAWVGHRARIERMIDATGSRLDEEGVELYLRLVRSPDHVAGALGMMAQWDLPRLSLELPRLEAALLLLVGDQDRTVPPTYSRRVQAMLPEAKLQTLTGLGHLAHEQRADLVAAAIFELESKPRQPKSIASVRSAS